MTLTLLETHKSFGGQQRKYRHDSKALGCEMVFSIYLPEKKEVTQACSLIWWLSGLTCTDDNFSQKAHFQRYANELSLAIVMPDTSPRGDVADSEDWDLGTGASFYINAQQSLWQENYQMYTYLTEELPEIVHALVPNFSGKESIMGHSMGGHGALMIGLKNSRRFSSISAFAPITNPTQVPWGQKAFATYLGSDESTWKQWDATQLIQQPDAKRPPIMITQGTADEFYEVQLEATAFLTAAKESHSQVSYHKEEGYDHSYFTIATFIETHLAFHHLHLTR